MRKYITLLLMLLIGGAMFSQTSRHPRKAVHHTAVKHKTKHKVTAKKRRSKTVVKHHKKGKVRHTVAKSHHYQPAVSPIFVDTHTNSAVVEIKNGKLFVNDEAVYTLKNRKGEDQKVIINYPAPEPAVQAAPQLESNNHPEEPAAETNGTPFLGVRTFDWRERGATVEDVLPGSPADDAGLWPGDVIRKIDDEEIDNSTQLQEKIKSHRVGDKVSISWEHYGEAQTTNVTLADMDKLLGDGCDCGCGR